MSLPAFGPISTPRLVIREVRYADLDDLFEVNGDREVTRFLPYATWQSREDGVAWFTRMTGLVERGNARQLVLARKDGDKVIGTLLLFKFDPGSARLEAEVNSSNVASIRLLRSLGFVHEGTLRTQWIAKGAEHDTDMYGLLSVEWPNPAADSS